MGSSAKQELYDFVGKLRNDLNIKETHYPISTIDLCNKSYTTELLFHSFKTRGICGTALLGKKINTIILNNKRTSVEQNFDCGHEIIHLTKHMNIDVKFFNCFESALPEQNGFLEWEANEGSAELLVPYKLLLPLIKQNREVLSSPSKFAKFRAVLAQKFHVPVATIYFRIESLKYEIHQHLNGVPIDQIIFMSDACQKQQNINVQSLNDFKKTITIAK